MNYERKPRNYSLWFLLLGSLFLSFLVGNSQNVSKANWKEGLASPRVEFSPCARTEGEKKFLFTIRANGTWEGTQLISSQSVGSEAQKLRLSGQSLPELGEFLRNSPCGLSNFVRTVTLELSGQVLRGETLNFNLPVRPSTGYLWEIKSLDKNLAVLNDSLQVQQITPYLGGIAIQSIRVRALRSALVTFQLYHHRSWEADTPVDTEFCIQGEQILLSKLVQHLSVPVYDPNLADQDAAQALPLQGTPSQEQVIAAQALPAAFNWCVLGKCTPVRDQRGCGSCWAFATVGVLESKLLIAGNHSQDLSEQYLVSCNTDGWSCNGGWFAHDYHIWKIPPGESEAGAVLESDFAYQAANIPCNGPYAHPYRALSWAYVNRYVRIPSEIEIKQAIYTHGPVAAAVCAGPAFTAYRSGVFYTDERTACGNKMVDHGIVLVGWDDAQGVWILRNSWGGEWGENGYMRIKYGISNVGLGANYLVYTASPSPTTPPPTTPSPSPVPITPVPPSPPSPSPYPEPSPSELHNYLPAIFKVFP